MDWKDIASVELPAGAQVADLITLIAQLDEQAKAVLAPRSAGGDAPRVRSLAEPVADALAALLEARDTLVALEKRRPAHAASPANRDTVASNLTADDAWRALSFFLEAARVCPDALVPGRAEAEVLHARLFGRDGLRFINLRARRQWDAAQRLVAVLEEPETRETLEALGGARYVDAVLTSHQEFGLSHGFAQATPLRDTVTNTRAEQLALQSALRDYLVKVAAQVSARRPESGALAAYLLQPYTDLARELSQSARSTPKDAEAPPSPIPASPTL